MIRFIFVCMNAGMMKYVVFLMLMYACSGDVSTGHDQTETDSLVSVSGAKSERILFNEERAFLHVKNQVDFGPRVPGTPAHKACHAYISEHMKKHADTVYLQYGTAKTFDGKYIPVMNIIASINPNAVRRILLCAHWDTRPYADEDSKDKDKPIPGANDGASGVGVLMELAEVLSGIDMETGVDIVLFDAEDWGDPGGRVPDSYCLGSQYWGMNLHKVGYRADFGILLDMVGAPNATFGFEGYSLEKASRWLSMVWSAAAAAGYERYFKSVPRGYVTDDHFYVMKYTGIPTIDIIDYDPNTSSRFGKYWHTHSDNLNAIDKNTLKAVGQTVLNVIMDY